MTRTTTRGLDSPELLPYGLGSKIRVVRRSRQIASVFLSFGLSDLLARFHLPAWLLPEAVLGDSEATVSTPQRVREAFEELGPTFVKLGQFLATRKDLLADEWTQEFSRLHHAVRPVAWPEIERQLRIGLGDKVEIAFQKIDREPLAAGSVAQIHRATLLDGSEVVLKILRPGIREVIQADLEVLDLVAVLSERHSTNLGIRPTELVQEFAEDRRSELNLMHEGRATERLGRLFSDDPDVVFPRVYWQVSSSRVLALELLEGVTVASLDPDSIDAANASRFVERGCRAVVRQCLEFGFFHADPHPGNILYMPGDRVGFVDCGITGYLDRQQRHLLMTLVEQILESDAEGCQRTAVELAGADPALEDDRHLRRSIQDFLVDFDQVRIEQLDITRLLSRLFETLRQHEMVIRSDLIKLLKALSAVEAVAERLCPGFALAREVSNELTVLAARGLSPQVLASRLAGSASAYAHLLERLPRDLSGVLGQLRRNEFNVQLSHGGLGRLTAAILFASRLLAGAVIVASLLVAGSILLMASDQLGQIGRLLGYGSLLTASALGFFLGAKHFRYRDLKH